MNSMADPTNVTLRQAQILALLAKAGPSGLAKNSDSVREEYRSLDALCRRGLVRLLTQPTGYDFPKWTETWLVTDLGQAVLAGGLVHTQDSVTAENRPVVIVFRNGQAAGSVTRDERYYPPLGRGTKWTPGWEGWTVAGETRDFQRKDAAVAWVAGGAK